MHKKDLLCKEVNKCSLGDPEKVLRLRRTIEACKAAAIVSCAQGIKILPG